MSLQRQEMIAAIRSNDVEKVKNLIGGLDRVDMTLSERGETTLMLAAYYGNMYILAALCNMGANRDANDFLGNSVFHYAAISGNVEAVINEFEHVEVREPAYLDENTSEVVLPSNKYKANLNIVNNKNETALMLAAKYGHAHAVEALIKRGALLTTDQISNSDETKAFFDIAFDSVQREELPHTVLTSYLIDAIIQNNDDIVKYILDKCISLGQELGSKVLNESIINCNYLIFFHANDDMPKDKFRVSPLSAAAMRGRTQTVCEIMNSPLRAKLSSLDLNEDTKHIHSDYDLTTQRETLVAFSNIQLHGLDNFRNIELKDLLCMRNSRDSRNSINFAQIVNKLVSRNELNLDCIGLLVDSMSGYDLFYDYKSDILEHMLHITNFTSDDLITYKNITNICMLKDENFIQSFKELFIDIPIKIMDQQLFNQLINTEIKKIEALGTLFAEIPFYHFGVNYITKENFLKLLDQSVDVLSKSADILHRIFGCDDRLEHALLDQTIVNELINAGADIDQLARRIIQEKYLTLSHFQHIKAHLGEERFIAVLSDINFDKLVGFTRILSLLNNEQLINIASIDNINAIINLENDLEILFDALKELNETNPELITQRNINILIATGDQALDAARNIIRGEPVLNGNIRNLVEDEQNTHLASVHKSASESAIKLREAYKESLQQINFKNNIYSIQNWANSLSESERPIKECVLRLIHEGRSHLDRQSNTSLLQLLVLTWVALNDASQIIGSRDDGLARFKEGLLDLQNNYGPNDPSCPSGSFNKLIEILVGIHPDAELIVVTLEQASTKFQAVVKQEVKKCLQELKNKMSQEEFQSVIVKLKNDGPGVVWDKIKDSVTELIMDEFGSLYDNNKESTRFQGLLSNHEFVQLSNDDLKEFEVEHQAPAWIPIKRPRS